MLQGKDSVLGYFPSGTWYSLLGQFTVAASEKDFWSANLHRTCIDAGRG